jgi:hypothetical protein
MRDRAPETAAAAALAGLVLAAWSPHAAALDRMGAIEVAKRQMGSQCSATRACSFDAKLENGKWNVRVQFTKGEAASDKPSSASGGHAIFMIDQRGKVVGRIEGK